MIDDEMNGRIVIKRLEYERTLVGYGFGGRNEAGKIILDFSMLCNF